MIDVKRFYRNQLSEAEKLIYDTLEINSQKIMANEPVMIGQVDKDTAKSEICEVIDASLVRVITAYQLDNPMVSIFLDIDRYCIELCGSKSDMVMIYPNIETGGTYSNFKNAGEKIKEIELISNEVIKKIETAKDKTNAIYDWLLKNAMYSDKAVNKNNMIGCLLDKRCNCVGYTHTFKYIADKVGVPAISVIGIADRNQRIYQYTEEEAVEMGLGHAWNNVMYNGYWNLVDTALHIKPIYLIYTINTHRPFDLFNTLELEEII